MLCGNIYEYGKGELRIMKKQIEYTVPRAEIKLFSVCDIITSSTTDTTHGWDGEDDPVELPKTEM